MKIEKFEDLQVWQKAHRLALGIYKVTKGFPADERFGLVSQMRRSAVSVPANIAEGFSRRTAKEKLYFYNIAQGSLEELKYYLILGRDLGYMENSAELRKSGDEVGRMLHGLSQSLIS